MNGTAAVFRKLLLCEIHTDMTMRTTIPVALAALMISASLTVADTASSPETSRPGWFRRAFGSLSWDEVASVVESPRDICWRIRMHVSFRAKIGDSWASGKETWESGHGDCEDFAACVTDLCKKEGFQADLYVFHVVRGTKNLFVGHVVVVGEWKGKMWFSSNGSWHTADSFDEVTRRVASSMNWKPQDTRSETLADAIERYGLSSGKQVAQNR
jgi:hypothetical protein